MHEAGKVAIILLSVLLLLSLVECAHLSPSAEFPAVNYERVYYFMFQLKHLRLARKLYVSVPLSLYDYYRGLSHRVPDLQGYSRFVTPEVVKPIAESIQSVVNDDEEFANAVLTMVHQIPYVRSGVRYPVETLVGNSGNCGALSLLAASIMKAGGLDVVLFYYEGINPPHMNVGVYLPHTPIYHTWWMVPKHYEYEGKKYWVSECTPWTDWRVGDQPVNVDSAGVRVIPLENFEKPSPASISASLDAPLRHSSISLTVSSELNIGNGACILPLSGSISPRLSSKRVTIYVSQDRSFWKFITAYTDNIGKFSLTYNLTSTGMYYIRASWDGDSSHAGSDSETLTVFVRFPLARASAADAYRIPQFLYNQSYRDFSKTILEMGENISLSGELLFLSGENANCQFGFMLRHDGENYYYVSVDVMDAYRVLRITKRFKGNDTVLANASVDIAGGEWCRITAETWGDKISVKLYAENGTLLRSIFARDNDISAGEFKFVAKCGVTATVLIKLKIRDFDQSYSPAGDNQPPANALKSLTVCIALATLLATVVVATYLTLCRLKKPGDSGFVKAYAQRLHM